jgi:hypothetical protein
MESFSDVFPAGPEMYSASAATSAITDEDRQVLATTRAPERLREWSEVEEKEAYLKLLWWGKTRERRNGTLPELRAWLDFKAPMSADVKALLRTLAGCAERNAHTGRVIDFFSQHRLLNEPYICGSRCALIMQALGLVKAELPWHYREPELNISEYYEELGGFLQAWAAKEYDRLQALPGLEGEDELTHNLRAALVWDLVSTTAADLDDAVANFLYYTKGSRYRDPDLGAATKHCRHATCLYYIICMRAECPPKIEDGTSYEFGNLCLSALEGILLTWFDEEAHLDRLRAEEQAFAQWLGHNHDAEPKLYKKHAHYDTLREYVAGWFASTRLRQTVFSCWETARWIPDSKRFKAAGEEWNQLATAAH